MFDRNALWIGLVLGLAVPFAGYGVLLMVSEKLETALFPNRTLEDPLFDPATLLAIAVCLNLIPLHYFNRRRYSQSMRGVMTATMVYVAIWLFLFGKVVLQG